MKHIHFSLFVMVVVAGLGLCGAVGKNMNNETAAVEAAQSWLMLVDAQRYTESWETAATYFKNAVTAEQWIQVMPAVRGPLGKVRSRQLASTTFVTELPGAPDGEYVVIQYQTSFENKKSAIETITPMRDMDGSWKVSGYYIK